jgi:hypothetical protein
MTALLTYILGLVAAACACSTAILGLALYIHVRDVIERRRRMTAPQPAPPVVDLSDPDVVWLAFERAMRRGGDAA